MSNTEALLEHSVLITFKPGVPYQHFRLKWILSDFLIGAVMTKSGIDPVSLILYLFLYPRSSQVLFPAV